MADDKKQSIFEKLATLSHEAVDGYINELKKSNPVTTQKPYGMNVALPMRTSWQEDLERTSGQYGYKQKLTLLTDQHKLLMYLKNPIIGAIIQKRTTQVGNYTTPQKDKYSPGFRWVKKDDNGELSDKEKKTIQMLNDFIINCGLRDEERTTAEEDMSFLEWLKRSTKDTLIYDALATEFIRDHLGNLHHWLPVSGATVRLAASNLSKHQINDEMFVHLDRNKPLSEEDLKNNRYKLVQVVNGQIRKAFTKEEMSLHFRNGVNDFFTDGYPISELDLLMNVVQAHLNADNYNRSIFTNGTTSNGIINLKGEVDDDQLKAMRRSYYAQGVGPDAMLRTPIINAPEGLEYIKLDNSHKDLEYSNYINYLIKLICAIYQINPEEIGFTTGGKSDADGNSQNYNNVERKIVLSQEAGLRPLLEFFANIINEDILPRFSKELHAKYKFEFVGLGVEDRNQELDRHSQEVKIKKTVNEIRAESGLPPIPGADNLILDSIYWQWYSQMSPDGQKFQKEQNEQMQQASGGGDAGGAAVQYVDENGEPIDPSQIDPNEMEFTDEDGNLTDHQGNPLDTNKETDDSLPFESGEEDNEEILPFEEEYKTTEIEKLPFES
jgi:phage portal protein BeeE